MSRFIKVVLVATMFYTSFYDVAFASSPVVQYPELERIVRLIQFFVDVVRYVSSSVAAIIVGLTGWQVLTTTNGLETAKKKFVNSIVAFILIFGCNIIANFFVGKLADLLLG